MFWQDLADKALSVVSRVRIFAVDLTVYVANLLDGCKIFHCLYAVGHHIFTLLAGALEIFEAFVYGLVVPLPAKLMQPFYLLDFEGVFHLNGLDGYLFGRKYICSPLP